VGVARTRESAIRIYVTAHRAYIGIGSNEGDRHRNVERAVAALGDIGNVVLRSSLYRTAPWGKLEQPWFLNAVVLLETGLAPLLLLNALQAVEENLGRVRGERWGPRTIDLDLLLYDDLHINEPALRVPHPRLPERAFVLVPLAEIDDRFAPLRDSLRASDLAGVVRAGRESVDDMPEERDSSVSERVRVLARFLAGSDAVRVRITRGDEDVEIAVRPRHAAVDAGQEDRAPGGASAARIDTIKADLVGIFHVGRPTPAEGDDIDGDRELGYVEALGIRTPVHSMGAGRLIGMPAVDGAAVEYGQPLFLVARGN
ncbi:MAG TPA: 2-amino-4-hydroxy-6-hydroxymethyldihydropteridine diphosphokinase, partial [Candidatus Dormibacteraeota bacterium]|nr:2-amino-4-hydroxy-6-hydroxymethyldihydropteridine diphosphokinase [Candidatus Dormibacteraeota bacterium]